VVDYGNGEVAAVIFCLVVSSPSLSPILTGTSRLFLRSIYFSLDKYCIFIYFLYIARRGKMKITQRSFLLKIDQDLSSALKWKAKQLRSTSTRVLIDYLLTLRKEQEQSEGRAHGSENQNDVQQLSKTTGISPNEG
jgi:hypothetical protein